MKRPNVITERMRLDACSKGECVKIPGISHPSRNTLEMIIAAIKPIARGRVQVKYRSQRSPNGVVQKIDLDGSIMVERIRDAVEADGPGAGVPVHDTVEHEGIVYQTIDPADDAADLLTTHLAAGPEPTLTPSDLVGFLSSVNMRETFMSLIARMPPSIGGSGFDRSRAPGDDLRLIDVRLH